MAKVAKVKRTTVSNYDPSKLIIIGLDTDDGPEHHLYDERVNKKIPEAMIKNVESMGIIETISVTKVGTEIYVVNGRRRVMAARKANERLIERGEEPILVPALTKKGDEESLMGVLIAGNEHRLDDDPITRAEKAQRLKDRGRNNVQIGTYFGVSGTAIGNWLKVLDCVGSVKNAVSSGALSMSAAIEISVLPPEEQEEALLQMLETGKKSVNDAKDLGGGEGGEGGGGSGSSAPRKALIRKIIEHERAGKVLGNKFLQGVSWAIGDLDSDGVKGLADLLEDVS